MVVFTITHPNTQSIYVATSSRTPESRWSKIAQQADEQHAGEIFDEIRQYGADSFVLSEWGVADDPSEVRALVNEAQQELGAVVVQTRSFKAESSSASTCATPLSSIRRELADIFAELDGDSSDDDDMEDLDNIATDEDEREEEDEDEEVTAQPAATKPAEKPASRNVSSLFGSSEPEVKPIKRTAAPKPPADEIANAPQRRTEQREENDQMRDIMVGIERRRLSMRKTPPKAVKEAKSKANAAAASKATPSTGRASSSAKEKRIREAIKQEREARQLEQQQKAREDAAEMKSVMIAIEARRLAAKEANSAKAKARAKAEQAAARKAATAAKKAAAEQEQAKASLSTTDASASTAARATSAATPSSALSRATTRGTLNSDQREQQLKAAIAQEQEEQRREKEERAQREEKEVQAVIAALNARRQVMKGQARSSAPKSSKTEGNGNTAATLKEQSIKQTVQLPQDQAEEMVEVLAQLDAGHRRANTWKRKRR